MPRNITVCAKVSQATLDAIEAVRPVHVTLSLWIAEVIEKAATAAPPNPWIPYNPYGLPPETYPFWRRQIAEKRLAGS